MFSSGRLTGLHHKCLEDLQRAARGGCKICISLVLRREKIGSDTDNEQTTMPFLNYSWTPGKDYGVFKKPLPRSWSITFNSDIRWLKWNKVPWWNQLYVHISSMEEAVPYWYASLSSLAASDLDSQPWKVRRDMFPLREIADNTGQESVLEVGKVWLEHCYQSHNCESRSGPVDSTWYPKRLVCLTDTTLPRLLDTDLEPPDNRYATLSHCWGSEPSFLTLKTDNIDSFRKGIPINTLPKSFRDAVFICDRLSIRYIWIDSLCIIQDSESDWLLHTEYMSLIYQNCYLNLSFDAAKDPGEGAFRHRNTDVLQECCAFSIIPRAHCSERTREEDPCTSDKTSPVFSSTDASSADSLQGIPDNRGNIETYNSIVEANRGSTGLVNTKRAFRCFVFTPELDFTCSTWGLPLSSRGWVVQERLLSPRVLHFTNDRLMWECEESPSLHEAFPSGVLGSGKPFDISLQPFNCFPAEKPHRDPMEHFFEWARIVQRYSDCQLTYPEKDKLVAFSAVAQRFSAVFGPDYYAGHFQRHFPLNLVWYVEKLHSGKTSATRRYPTWSWTSVDAKVVLQNAFSRSLVGLEHMSGTLLDSSHRFGLVKGGQLRMRCLITRCMLGLYQGQRRHTDIRTVHVNEIFGSNDHFSDEFELTVALDGPKKDIHGDVYFAPVCEYSKHFRHVMGLMLVKRADGYYERVGCWNARHDYLFHDLKSGVMFEIVDKYLGCRQVVVIV